MEKIEFDIQSIKNIVLDNNKNLSFQYRNRLI